MLRSIKLLSLFGNADCRYPQRIEKPIFLRIFQLSFWKRFLTPPVAEYVTRCIRFTFCGCDLGKQQRIGVAGGTGGCHFPPRFPSFVILKSLWVRRNCQELKRRTGKLRHPIGRARRTNPNCAEGLTLTLVTAADVPTRRKVARC